MRAGWRWLLAVACLPAGCHRQAMPPRPDGAAVVIAPETVDDGIATVPEMEPNDTLTTAQRLVLTPGAPVAIGGNLQPRPPAAKRDVDVYRIDVPVPDAGAAAGPVPPVAGRDAAAASAPPPRLLLRAELQPGRGPRLDARGARLGPATSW